MKMYIAVLDTVPDFMTPTLVAHAVLGHHLEVYKNHHAYEIAETEYEQLYSKWLENSFKKVTLRVNQKEFDKIAALPNVGLFHENKTLDRKKSCAVIVVDNDVPSVLQFAKMWSPLE